MTRALLALTLLFACGEDPVKDQRALDFLEEVGAPVCPSTATQLVKTYYVNCYQDEWVVARWVGYRLSAPEIDGPGERKDNFKEDPELPATTRADNDDYEAYFDRGHMAPAGDFQRNQEAMDQTFYLSNMAPQEPIFNRGPWADLEAAVRDEVRSVQVAWVYTGNLFLDDNGQPNEPALRIGRHGVSVPTHNWKAVLSQRSDGTHQAYGYILPNSYPSPDDWWSYNVAVDQVEGLTGLDFFSRLPEDVENNIEALVTPLSTAPRCGNEAIDEYLDEEVETCDGTELGAVTTCADLGYLGTETPGCLPTCGGLDLAGCTGAGAGCGDGTASGSEQCDGADLGGARCTDLWYASGNLSCRANCSFDVSGCVLPGRHE